MDSDPTESYNYLFDKKPIVVNYEATVETYAIKITKNVRSYDIGSDL